MGSGYKMRFSSLWMSSACVCLSPFFCAVFVDFSNCAKKHKPHEFRVTGNEKKTFFFFFKNNVLRALQED